MPVSLSRIEREYVILNLEELLPPLSILADKTLFTIPEKSYSIKEEQISISGFLSGIKTGSIIQVHFRHKKRGMFFSSHLLCKSDINFSFNIAPDMFKDDISLTLDVAGKTKIRHGDTIYESFALSSYPLDFILVDPGICISRFDNMQKIADKAGIEQCDSLVSYRLFEYLDGFRQSIQSERSEPFTGHFFFIDHQFILISVQKLKTESLENGTLFPLSVTYDKRFISVDSVLKGFIPLNADLTVLCLDIGNAQKEDKRFLFEKMYKQTYQE